MPLIIQAQIVDIGPFKGFYFNSIPPRLETSVVFDGQSLNQKLIYQMMDISWRHGFGCSAPQFSENNLVFSIGTTLPSVRSLRRYSSKMQKCLEEIYDFSTDLARQLDFSILDISMFDGIDPSDLDLLFIAAVRDQQYNGDWDAFHRAMKKSQREDEAKTIEQCRQFENVNKKDIGLVGNKLIDTLFLVSESRSHQN